MSVILQNEGVFPAPTKNQLRDIAHTAYELALCMEDKRNDILESQFNPELKAIADNNSANNFNVHIIPGANYTGNEKGPTFNMEYRFESNYRSHPVVGDPPQGFAESILGDNFKQHQEQQAKWEEFVATRGMSALPPDNVITSQFGGNQEEQDAGKKSLASPIEQTCSPGVVDFLRGKDGVVNYSATLANIERDYPRPAHPVWRHKEAFRALWGHRYTSAPGIFSGPDGISAWEESAMEDFFTKADHLSPHPLERVNWVEPGAGPRNCNFTKENWRQNRATFIHSGLSYRKDGESVIECAERHGRIFDREWIIRFKHHFGEGNIPEKLT